MHDIIDILGYHIHVQAVLRHYHVVHVWGDAINLY